MLPMAGVILMIVVVSIIMRVNAGGKGTNIEELEIGANLDPTLGLDQSTNHVIGLSVKKGEVVGVRGLMRVG